MDMTEDESVWTLYVGPNTTYVGAGNIMLVPSDTSVDFFSAPKGLPNGYPCDADSVPEAVWLPIDVNTMLPTVSWWRIPALKLGDADFYIHACRDGFVQSRGIVKYQQVEHTDSPTKSPTQIPTKSPTVLPTALPTMMPTAQIIGETGTLSTRPTTLAPTFAPVSYTNIAGTWEAVGSEIAGPGFGSSVAMAWSGRVVAVGSPVADEDGRSNVFVYGWNSDEWEQLGQKLSGREDGNGFGQVVALSRDGDTLAVGAHRNDNGRGQARVYRLVDGQWDQMGKKIDGDSPEDTLGMSLDISQDGRTLAVGAHGAEAPDPSNNNEVLLNAGKIQVYIWDEDVLDWVKDGPPVYGTGKNDNFGNFVSLAVDSDGNTIVAGGARGYDGQDNTAGHVRVYRLVDGEWETMGQALESESYEAAAGRASLSADGQRIVTGSIWAGNRAGRVNVYEYNSYENTWEMLGQPFRGSANDWLGLSVDISPDGTTVSAGAVFHNTGEHEKTGQILVFRYNDEEREWMPMGGSLEGEGPDDNLGRSVALSRRGNIMVAGAFWFKPLSDSGAEGRVRMKIFERDGVEE
eukprot:scaffold39709_cov168-Amphora_coffeaeformis.AAC.2